jgi:predicted metal-dependent peptidase
VEAEAVIVFTDGYLESEITWNVKCPTLWLVTQNNNFVAPSGKVVKKED